jgi:hypothetical protein
MAEQMSGRVEDALDQARKAIEQVESSGDPKAGHALRLKYHEIQVVGYGLIAVAEAIRDQTRQQANARH